MHLLTMTPDQLDSYRSIWDKFTDFDWVFYSAERLFGFYGRLEIADSGAVELRELLVACSREHQREELEREIGELAATIQRSPWRVSHTSADSRKGALDEYHLELSSEETQDDTLATHLLLSYGEATAYRERHLGDHFCLRSQRSEDSRTDRAEYYPIRAPGDPSQIRCMDLDDLTPRLTGRRLVAFTGAGISRSSGIPTFIGNGGLSDHFPLIDVFPGEVVGWMVQRPQELAETLGRFQASFLTALPTPAHRALAALESAGLLKHIITGNGDLLHERGGSRNVHNKSARYFTESQQGWQWLKEGEVLLAVGVGRDEHGILSWARDHNLQIVAISPDPPPWVCAGDWFVQGSADEVLPGLCQRLICFALPRIVPKKSP